MTRSILLRLLILLALLCPGCLRQDVIPVPPPVVVDPVAPVEPVTPIDINDPLRVLILYEQDELKNLPQSQVDALQSLKVRDWLDAHGADYRIWDKDVKTQYAPKFWQEAVKLPRDRLPWIWISGHGQRGVNGAYPDTTEAALQLLENSIRTK